MINIVKCPCEECLIVPICRHKTIHQIYGCCDSIVKYLALDQRQHEQHMKKFPIFYEILRPTTWSYTRWNKTHSKYNQSYEVFKI
jgi:hypothetical protein